MSDGSDGTRPLGRIRLQRKRVATGYVEHLDGGDATREPLSTTRAALSAEPIALSRALCTHQGALAIDLRKVVIPISVLAHVTREVAVDTLMLPLYEEGERLFVAVGDPTERRGIEELEFISGRRVTTYLALHGSLRDAIEEAYAARAAGASYYRAPLAESPHVEPDDRVTLPEGARVARAAEAAGLPEVLAPPEPRFDEELSRPLGHTLPSAPAPAASPPPEQPADAPKRLLIVDDNEDIRRVLVRAFRERDYEVVESARGLDALEKVRACALDAVVLEATLPEVHGFDICRRIKGSRRYGHIPLIMVSAVYRGWRIAEDLHRSYGVDAFFEKPFRVGDVIAAVERATRGAGKSQPPDEAEPEGAAADHLRASSEAYARGEVEAAIEALKNGLAVDPLAFRLHYHLGLLYGKQENVFEAIQALETAIDLKPRDFSTSKNLAVLYQRAGFRLKATEMWERALASAPDEDTRMSIRNHLLSLL